MNKIIFIAIVQYVIAQDNWHPLSQHELSNPYSGISQLSEANIAEPCGLYKVGFTQEPHNQYVEFKVDMPELKEFTLCFWNKFSNHSNDHPIFSYGVKEQPKMIYSWVSNTESSSFYSMAINGQTYYRLNYPLRSHRWYHTCQSWNGKTGEWQIWVNAERVGRGFNNRLVGFVIPEGGVTITGQNQGQADEVLVQKNAVPTSGMIGEVTMIQLYNVALTAGKAHKDHKHHHAHKFDHNGAPITSTPSPIPVARPSQPTHPLLTGGQLNPGAALNIAAQQPQLVQGQQFNAQYLNGQFAPDLVSQQLTAAQSPQPQNPSFISSPPTNFNDLGSYSQQSLSIGGQPLLNSGLVHPSGLQTHDIYKRKTNEFSNSGKDKKKRDLIFEGGRLVDDGLVSYDQNSLLGLAGIGQNMPILQKQKKEEEREPAEAEVTAVMNICSGCDPEPFAKALVFGWRTVGKTMYSGAIYTPAVTECRVF